MPGRDKLTASVIALGPTERNPMAADTDSVIQTLKAILAAKVAGDLDADEISDEEPLMDGGLNLDSIGIVELIGLVETEFDFQFQDSDLRTATFENVTTLADVISSRLNG
jgi:acyl carrier protein